MDLHDIHHFIPRSRLKKLLRELFCAAFCDCDPPRPLARIRLSFGARSIQFIGDRFMATVKDTDGPFELEIKNFIDSKNNPTTDTDVPVWAATGQDSQGNDLVALAASDADPSNPQKQKASLNGGIGQAQVTATFGDPANGGFVVTGVLDIQPGAAVSATMGITGPGLQP